jgi:hypothetical protein
MKKGNLPSSAWPEEHLVTMLDLLDTGLNKVQVAEKMTRLFRKKYTKNMVTGMCYRLRNGGFLD